MSGLFARTYLLVPIDSMLLLHLHSHVQAQVRVPIRPVFSRGSLVFSYNVPLFKYFSVALISVDNRWERKLFSAIGIKN
jgi:hypothetical protein